MIKKALICNGLSSEFTIRRELTANRDQWRVICGSTSRHTKNKAQLITSVRPFGPSFETAHSNDFFHRRTKNLDHSSYKNHTARKTGGSTSGQFWQLSPRGARSKNIRERLSLRNIYTKVRPTGLKNRRSNSHKSQSSKTLFLRLFCCSLQNAKCVYRF